MALKVGRMVVFTALATAAGHVLVCRCSQTTPQSCAFSLESLRFPPVFLRWRRVSEEISCLVVESDKCYQRVGGESFLCCYICRKSHIHRELHGAIKENS